MLDKYYFGKFGWGKYMGDNSYRVMVKKSGKKNAKPVLAVYSPITRGYAFIWGKDTLGQQLVDSGADVYLIDWGDDGISSNNGDNGAMDYVDRIKVVVEAIKAEYKVEQINGFFLCASTVFAQLYFKQHKKDFKRVGMYDALYYFNRDIGQTYTIMFTEPVTKFVEKNFKEVSQYYVDYAFVLPSVSLFSLMYSNMKIVQESGLAAYMDFLRLANDDRWIPSNFWKDALEYMDQDTQGDIEAGLAHSFKGVEAEIFNIVGDDDIIVKPSASIIGLDAPEELKKLVYKQKVLDTGHFCYARKCEEKTEETKKELAEWLAT